MASHHTSRLALMPLRVAQQLQQPSHHFHLRTPAGRRGDSAAATAFCATPARALTALRQITAPASAASTSFTQHAHSAVTHTHLSTHYQPQPRRTLAYQLPLKPPPAPLPIAEIPVELRAKSGKHHCRYLRDKHDLIPAAIQQPGVHQAGKQPLLIGIDKWRWAEQHRRGCLKSRVFRLTLSDGTSRNCILNDYSLHPITMEYTNLYFIEHHEEQRVRIAMPFDFEGLDDCIGVKRGGVFQQLVFEIPFWYRGPAENVPQQFRINVQSLNINKKLALIRDVSIPEGCTLVKPSRHYVFASLMGAGRGGPADDEEDAPAAATPVAAATAKKAGGKGDDVKAAAAAITQKAKK